jgi:hypothetical protein
MLWGATGSWKPLNTQTYASLKMVVTSSGTTMNLNDTGMLENTSGALYQIYPETTAASCTGGTEQVGLSSIVDSRTITVTRAQNGTTAYAHCNEDYFWGPLNRSVTWAITVVDSTHFSVLLDSSSFGSFSGQTIHINRASAYSGQPVPYLVSSTADGSAPLIEVNNNNQLTMTIDGCPSRSNAITCSFGYTDPFNQKAYGDRGPTGSLVVASGTGTLTLSSWSNNTTQYTRTLQANELMWLWNFSDSRVNRPWVTNTVTGTCSSSCVITIANMGAGQGGTAVPDGTYTVTGTDLDGNSFYFPIFADYYTYWGPGLATISDYATEYPAHMVKGTFSNLFNRYRAWYCWSSAMTAIPMEFGTYVSEQPSGTAYHGYHSIVFDAYGSTGSCQWQLFEVNAFPFHWVGGSQWFPQGTDSTYTGWMGFIPWTGEINHYFDINRTFYMNLSSIYSIPGAQTSYIGPMYMDTVTGEPEEWVPNKAMSYNPGSGKFHLNVVAGGGPSVNGPCSSSAFKFYYATSELKALGLSSATADGTTTGVNYGVNALYEMNHDSPPLAFGNLYYGIVPEMCISGVTGSGVSPIAISFRQDPNMAAGDHVTVTGVGGNTAANQSTVAINTVVARQEFYRSNQGASVTPNMTGITVTGGNTCTANLTVSPTVFVGQEGMITGAAAAVNLANPGGANFFNVTAVGTNSFSWSCLGATNGTYNTDYDSTFPLGVMLDPVVTLTGTGNGAWDGAFTGTMTSTENNKNFAEVSFLPPGLVAVASAPTVATTAATGITGAAASAGGTVSSNGGAPVTSEGTCYSTSPNPTTPCTSDGTATPFTSSLTGLSPSTLYYYRAFATNSVGTSYGSDLSFTTTVTLSSITVSDTGQHYCRVVGDVSPDAYVQVYYGVTSGGPYPYNTYPYKTGVQTAPSDSGVFALDMGGLASGTSYYFVVQARPNINNSTGQIQSAEYNCTTTTGSPFPAAPALYRPNYPSTTSGYTTITLTLTANAFVAASTVTHAGGMFCGSDSSWTITAGDSLQAILNEVSYGAIIEFPQSTTGLVPNLTFGNGGYQLPNLTPDPCASGISDPNHRWIILRTHQVNASDFPPFGFRTGPAWTAIANLQAQTPASVPVGASGQIFTASLISAPTNPTHHFWLSNLEFSVNTSSSNGPWGTYFLTSDTEGNTNDGQFPASYIVLDRIYFNAPPSPAFSENAIAGGVGPNVFLTGNYLVGFQKSGSIAQGIYIEDCSTGPLSILNNEVDAAGQGIYFESVSKSGCGSGPPVSLQNVAVLRNAVYAPPAWLNPTNPGYGAWDGVSRGNNRNPFESKNCQMCLFRGNWVDGAFSGQNSGEAFLFPGVTNATKTTGATGEHDIELSFNYVRHASVFSDVWGSAVIDACCGYAPDVALTSQVLMHDNLAVDLGRYLYTQSGSVGGLYSNYFISYGVQNHLIYNNSLAFTNGDFGASGYFIPDILGVSDGGISSNGFQFTGNLLYISTGVTGNTESGIIAPTGLCPGGCATFPVIPLPTTTTYATILHTTMVQIASSVTSSSFWGFNAVICGTKATGAEPWPDMSSSDCATQSGNMPAGDLYPPGNTVAARQTAAGLLKVANSDLTVTPTANNFGGAVGANIQGVLSALGIVKNIIVLPGASSLQFSYTAPDNNACSVDTSPNGTTWTRSTASGGSRNQTILVTSLGASTAYQYRLMCYYSQSRPWFSFPSESSNMATEGSARTTASGTSTVSVSFSLPSGAASVKVTLTPLVGSAATATCSSSPCSVAGVTNGANQETIQYWSGPGATGKMLVSGSTWLP